MNDPTKKPDSSTAAHAIRSKIAVALLATGALGVTLPTHADLPTSNVLLTISPGVVIMNANGTAQQNVNPGSWFGMDTNGNGVIAGTEKTALSQGTKGLLIGVTTSAGASHGGAPTAGDTNAITAPWSFFGNTGSDYVRVAPTVTVLNPGLTPSQANIDFSGWTVTWNGVVAINMGGGAWGTGPLGAFSSGAAQVVCASACTDGDTYTLEYTATVPNDGTTNFGNVKYKVHLEGLVVTTLRALNDSAVTTVNHPVNINVLANDAALNGIDPTSVVASTNTSGATVSVNHTTGVVTYTPPSNFSGPDTFTYTFKDKSGTPLTSNTATVSVDVQVNVAPTANDDAATVIVGTSTAINVLANDTDPNGNINPASVTVTQPAHPLGTVSVDPTTGVVTYTAGTTPGSDSFTYTVSDTGGASPAVSNTATVTLTVNPWVGDWTNPITAGTVPMLMIETGSYFTMQMTPTNTLQTNLSAGADSGVILGGVEQYAAGTHSGPPNGNETTGIDQAWGFFGNTGMHLTKNGGITANNTSDGTLNFDNRWFVTWNGIPAINMGGSTEDSPVVRGKAAIVCSPAPCANGSTYTLNYMAHVPQGDPSGFGGVPYGLHLVGHVRFLNTTLTGTGTIGPNPLNTYGTTRVTATQLLNAGVAAETAPGTPCVGDCFDFRVTGFSGGRAKVVLPLAVGIRPNSTYRKYSAGAWHDFDTTAGDTIKSAPLLANSGNCPAAGDASFAPGLTAGNRCVQLDIADNGPNDANNAAGTIDDPSGVLAPAAVVVDNRTTNSSGCSLSTDPVSVLKRADWLLLLGFVGWLGLVARRKRAS